ncbi:hypothetical protein PCANB_002781 [Pneumocystis canis]|nr:hypothetical protein PCANB_002781 [Pneumocystis canis]
MNHPTFLTKYLFGGAISTSLPSDFIDASEFRQIPDHQEVLVNINDERSLIIEIVEYVSVDDINIAKFHFESLAQDNGAEESLILNEIPITLEKSKNTVYLIEGLQKIFKCNKQTINPKNDYTEYIPSIPYVAVFLSVLRLHEKFTDIVITMNVPFSEIKNLHSFLKDSQLILSELEGILDLKRPYLLKNIFDIQETQFSTRKILLNLFNTFHIHDWSLFKNN